jgi:sn-glycerol 3-phosphate transport system permease protein
VKDLPDAEPTDERAHRRSARASVGADVTLRPPRTAQHLPGALTWRRGRELLLFAAFVGPNLAVLALFTYKPLLESIYYSTLQWNIGSPQAMQVGLDNYINWFQDPQTARIVLVTTIFTISTVVGGLVLGLCCAVLLNRRVRMRGPVRTILVAPYVLSGVAVGFLWLFVFDPNFGLLAAALRWISVPSPAWYNDPHWALAMIIIVQLWKNVGYIALIYLAGLQAIPQDLLDAAAVDGASARRAFWVVVFPLLSPTTFFLSVTTLLSSLQSFDIIQAMTKGGPLMGTTTMMYQIYNEGFVGGRAGFSSAVATILFVVLLVVTVIQLVFVQRRVHYS